MWFVYILKCSDDTFYTWITTDLDRRVLEHNTSNKSAKYTRMRRPVELIYSKKVESKSEAAIEEYRIKQLTRKQKEEFIKESI